MKGWVTESAHRCIRLYGDGWPARRPWRHIAGVLSHLDASCRRRISQLHAQQACFRQDYSEEPRAGCFHGSLCRCHVCPHHIAAACPAQCRHRMNTGMPSSIEWSVDRLGAATGEQAAETIQSICMIFRPPPRARPDC